MSGEGAPDRESDQLTEDQAIARLQGMRGYVEDDEYGYLDLTGIYDSDPMATTPYVVTGTFIPEDIGGTISVVNADADAEADGTLAQENLNQMLNNFLPGGYKQRWGDFDLWRGAWSHESVDGHADVGPMFECEDAFPLTDLLGDVASVAYTELPFDPDDVWVYVPITIRVARENKNDPQYVWLPEKRIVWTGSPPLETEPLSSDPTTNYLWFKHAPSPPGQNIALSDEDGLVEGFGYEDEQVFYRCYYASLLTLYPDDSTDVKSGLIRYRNEEDDTTAFIASKERSQLLTFDLDRDHLQAEIADAIDANPRLLRDLRVAYLQAQIWQRLFFEERALENRFAVEPLMEHLLGIDYWHRVVEENEMGVFDLSGTQILSEVEQLLPDDSDRHLRLLGHEAQEVSDAFAAIEDNPGTMAELLARCRNREFLIEFAERTLVHSAEHALSTWSNNLTGSGTSFELWYDVNFQEAEADSARISVYDPIQGGAGIAKEVYSQLRDGDGPDIAGGLARQGRCHSATADRATINLLADYPDGSLYDVYENDREEFTRLVEQTVVDTVVDAEAFTMPDLESHVKQRVFRLFETRELASFYSYVANEYTTVEDDIGRLPRIVDLGLHLERHVFTDPGIKTTYDRFADDSGRRDIAELGERLGELVVQCLTACPDCLKTDGTMCLHGTGGGQQETKLNRRLLTAVFDR